MSAILAKLGLELASALAPLIAAGAAALIAYLVKLFKSKSKNEQVQGALDLVGDLATTVVQQIEQTMVPTMKGMLKDGKLDDSEKAQLKQLALDMLKKLYGDKGLAALQKALGLGEDALMALLVGKLEQAVYNLPK